MKHLKNFKLFENMEEGDLFDDQEDFETGDFEDLEVIINDEDEFNSPSLDEYEPGDDSEEQEYDYNEFEEEDEEDFEDNDFDEFDEDEY